MINIVSRSVYQYHPTGPKKLVDNLIKGLRLAGIPFSLNKDPRETAYTWIHDDPDALTYLHSHNFLKGKNLLEKNSEKIHTSSSAKSQTQKYLFGPNIFLGPAEMEEKCPGILTHDNSILLKGPYLMPSEWVVQYWKKRGYDIEPRIWPVGVDTDRFAPRHKHGLEEAEISRSGLSDQRKNKVLVYAKSRAESDIKEVLDFLQERNIEHVDFTYGSYTEAALMDAAHACDYGIIIASSESQGLAIEELLAMDLPLIVFDIDFHNQKSWTDRKIEGNEYDDRDPATSVPYFDSRCGLVGKTPDEIKKHILYMQDQDPLRNEFSPREYILENLTLKKQALEFCALLGYPVENPVRMSRSEIAKIKNWKNRTWLRPKLAIKYALKYLQWKRRK